MTFKIEIRTKCKICHRPITQKHFRTYCSTTCRNKFFNKKNAHLGVIWQRNKRDKTALIASPDKIQCLICKKYYIQVCSHTHQVHGITGRKYREKYDLERKRGVLPTWYRELKGNIALNNGTYKNLKAGRKFRFKQGDKKAGRYKRSHITLIRLKTLHNLIPHRDKQTTNTNNEDATSLRNKEKRQNVPTLRKMSRQIP